MKMCPVCNTFQSIRKQCPFCHDKLVDGGRLADYLDPYGHYNDIVTSNLGDGYVNDSEKQQCPHLIYCEDCQYDEVFLVEEKQL